MFGAFFKFMNRLLWLRVLSGHRLKVILLMSALLFSTSLATFSASSYAVENADSTRMARFEQQFFARGYPQDSLEQRLNRLEAVVYGKSQPGLITTRTSRLLQALEKQYAPVKLSPAKHVNSSVADATDYYPTVTAIEQAVFKQTFIRQPITERLSRLETQTFHMSYSRNANSDRVDRLAEHYPNEVRMARIAQIARERQAVAKPRADVRIVSPAVQKLPPIDIDTRSLAHVAKPEKRRVFFARKAANSSDSSPNNARTEQAQFGVGASQGQSTQYSQEMMQMLPPQVREQMGGHRSNSTQIQQRIPATPTMPLQPKEPTAPSNKTSTPPTPGFLGVPLQ